MNQLIDKVKVSIAGLISLISPFLDHITYSILASTGIEMAQDMEVWIDLYTHILGAVGATVSTFYVLWKWLNRKKE